MGRKRLRRRTGKRTRKYRVVVDVDGFTDDS